VKPDEWFTEEAIAVSNHIVIRVNGKTAIDFVDKKNRQTRGHLAIQHLNPATIIQVRKAEVKRLPATKGKGKRGRIRRYSAPAPRLTISSSFHAELLACCIPGRTDECYPVSADQDRL
jgi:Domain of Unknown Function (DUF1080)